MKQQILNLTYPNEAAAKRFRQIVRDYCPTISYQGKESHGVWLFEVYGNSQDDSLELFYWLGLFKFRPTVFSTILK